MTDFGRPSVSVSHRTWLQRIELLNYRCFRQLTVNFDERLTVLSARNGAGKTAVLDAIAVAFGTFVGSFYTGKGHGIETSDVRLRVTNPKLREMEPQYPAVILAKGEIDGQSIEWARCINTPKSSTTIKEARLLTVIGKRMQAAVSAEQPVILPLVAYYGTGRLWNQKKVTTKKIGDSEFYSRTSGYQDCLDPASSYKLFKDWFVYAAKGDFDSRTRQRERLGSESVETETSHSRLIAAIREAVDVCLRIAGWHNLHYSFFHQEVVMEHPVHGILEVNQLSDGVRNMIALVADIAYRMVRLNSGFGRDAVRQTPGLVLIDEIDMHLHPEWQQIVLSNITAAFPKLQFVVTTHSPQVLSTVKREQVRLLSENIAGEAVAAIPEARTYGRSNADVLEAVMAVSPEPVVPESDALNQYRALIEQGDWRSEEVKELRRKLSAILGEDYPFLVQADMIIRRREALER